MRKPALKPLIAIAVLTCALQGAAMAQASPMAWSLGYASCKLRPASGTDEVLNGAALGGEYRCGPVWSMEASLSRQTGTEADTVDLRQWGVLVGLKASATLAARVRGFCHFLAGWEQLHAQQDASTDQSNSLAFGPGAGLEYAVTRNLSVRGQVDFLFTHYAGEFQRSPALLAGFVYRR
jgi:opacity protein-like surface antigen